MTLRVSNMFKHIIEALLWIGRAVNNKLLVALNAIGSQQALATIDTNKAIYQLLDHYATYPGAGSLYQSINMVPATHPNVQVVNKMKSKSQAGAHICFCQKKTPFPVGTALSSTVPK